jgi:hypothetical protein
MHFLFLFLDGIGLGPSDPQSNPFALAHTPNLETLFGGHKLVLETLENGNKPMITEFATLLGLDAKLGVGGPPQSASGQATILTGINVPEALGRHYGPKPNPNIRTFLQNGTVFQALRDRGYRTTLLNAYPESYFDAIASGRRLPGAVAMAALEAGIQLKTTVDLFSGRAISADFTGQGWRDRLKIPDTPVLSLYQAGQRLANLSMDYDFSFFEYWISDYAGHRSDFYQSISVVEQFDAVLGGLISTWDPNAGLIFITSDHGNLEDSNTRKHTYNLVPGLIFGAQKIRDSFTKSLSDLTDIAPAILRFFE